MPGEAGFEVARAYVVIEPDASGFPEKLKRDLESFKFDLKIPVSPDAEGFREKLQADLDADKGEKITVPVEPDADGFREKVAAATGGEKPVDVPVDPNAAGFEAKLAAAMAAAHATVDVPVDPDLAGFYAKLAAGLGAAHMGDEFGGTAGSAGVLTGALKVLDAELDAKKVAFATTSAAAGVLTASLLAQSAASARASATTSAAAGAANAAGASYRIWGTGMQVGQLALHGIISGLVEFLAVAIPATVAAGAWAATWAEGAGRVYEHMTALYTATEATANMFHETAGQALGLGDALQKAQTTAGDSQVYTALGGAINVAKESMHGLASTGLQVGSIFDNFMARLVYDFSAAGGAGKTFATLTRGMVPDLTQLGQVLGNMGHALALFAAQMPGLAQVMLRGLDGITHLISGLVDLSGHLSIAGVSVLTAVMAFHEFNTWGSVAVAALGRMGLATSAVTGGFFSLERAGGVLSNLWGVLPTLISNIVMGFGNLLRAVSPAGSAIERLGTNIAGLGSDIEETVAGLSLLELGFVALGVAAAVGLGIVVDKILTAKTASQEWSSSLQGAVNKASNLSVFNALGASMAQLSSKTAILSSATEHFGSLTVTATKNSAAYHDALANASQQMQSMERQFVTVGTHATDLANTYHTTLPGAMALADMAGVHLNQTMTKQAWAMGQIKIADLVAGYGAMGQSVGTVGSDMTVLAIQSALAATKVQALNQAEDQFMQGVTGGTTAVSGFVMGIRNITQGVASAVNNLSQGTGKMGVSVHQFANDLKSFSGQGAQAWQNFGQVVGTTAPQVVDWLRQAGAEGAVTGPQFSKDVLDMASAMIPLAEKSKTAQGDVLAFAQSNGIAVKTFPQLVAAVKSGHASMDDLSKSVRDDTIKMGNMSQVAQKLGSVMQSEIVSAMDAARLKVSGVSQATVQYTQDLRNNTAGTAAGQAARSRLIHDLEFSGVSAKTATGLVNTYAGSVAKAGGAAQRSNAEIRTLANGIMMLHGKTISINVLYNLQGANKVNPNPGLGILRKAAGGVIPGYAPGVDDRLIAVGPGEGILVPEAVKGLGGAAFVHAANRKYGGARVTRGNKTGQFAAGGVTGSATFAWPQDVFNFAITDNISAGWGGSPFGGGLFGERRSGATDKAMLAAGSPLVKAFADASLTTVSAIRAESQKAIAALQKYYSGPAASRLEATIKGQTAAMEKLAAASAKVSATISAMKSYASGISGNLASSYTDLSSIQAPTNAAGNAQPITGSYIRSQLQAKLATLRRFFKIIGELSKDKLGKGLISQVVALGPDAGTQYGEAILSGGKGLINELNKTETAIGGEEKLIGQRAADIQYGQSISKGFLSGLDKEKGALDKRMQALGSKIAEELAKALGVSEKTLEHDLGIGSRKTGSTRPPRHGAKPGPIVEHRHGGGAKAHPAASHVTVNLHLEGTKGSRLGPEDMAAIKHMIAQAVGVA